MKMLLIILFALLTSLFAGLPMQQKTAAATLTNADPPFSLAPVAFTFPNKGYIENIRMIQVFKFRFYFFGMLYLKHELKVFFKFHSKANLA